MLGRVVWTAVAAVLLSVGAIAAAVLTEDNGLVVALGLAGIAAATLAARER